MEDFIRPKRPEPRKMKKSYFIETIIIFVIIISITIGFAAGYFFRGNPDSVDATDSKVLSEVKQVITEEWYNYKGTDFDMDHASIVGLVGALGDDYASYWTSEEADEFNSDVGGVINGIGVTYYTLEEGGVISSVYLHSPAAKANIQVGDIILEIDGVSCKSKESTEIQDMILGKASTDVELTLLRNNKEVVVNVTRQQIDVSTNYEIRTTQNGTRVGYIGLTVFGNETASEVEDALELFKASGVENLVIDVRDNTGGYLTAAKGILDLFIESGQTMIQIQENSGPASKIKATNRKKYNFNEKYILINGQTASASEMLAGSLRDACGYKLVGETTFGKGIAQSQKTLSDGSVLKYTYASWLTAHGTNIQDVGLIPDIEVNTLNASLLFSKELEEPIQYDSVTGNAMIFQPIFNQLGYGEIREDGYYDEATKLAVEKFQQTVGMDVTGVYDNQVEIQLISDLLIYNAQVTNDNPYNKVVELIEK